jgi:hypothetical protein
MAAHEVNRIDRLNCEPVTTDKLQSKGKAALIVALISPEIRRRIR